MIQSIIIDIASKEITCNKPLREKWKPHFKPRESLHLEACTKRGNRLTMTLGYGKDLKGNGFNTYHRSFKRIKTQATAWKENPKYEPKYWNTPRKYYRKRSKENYGKKEPRPRTVRIINEQRSIEGWTVEQAHQKTSVSQRYSQQKAAEEGQNELQQKRHCRELVPKELHDFRHIFNEKAAKRLPCQGGKP